MRRMMDVPMLAPEDAAALIRTAFGEREWQRRVTRTIAATNLVAALWVARRETGKERLGDIIRWAREMEGRHDLHRR